MDADVFWEQVEVGTRRSRPAVARRARTHCPAGHAYDAANTYINSRGSRICRKCHAEWWRKNRGSATVSP